jgi:putative phosphoesterase
MPKLALISDVHANDIAFRAVLEDIERSGVDEIICLGDVVQGGPQPTETLDRLRAIGCRTVLGNADALVLEVPTDPREPADETTLKVREWTLAQLDSSHIDAVTNFAPVVNVELAGAKLVCFHASPRSYYDVLVPESDGSALEPFLGIRAADLLAGGHMHRQWTRRIEDALYVNPGAVGVYPDAASPTIARYAQVIVDELDAKVAIEFKAVPYAYAQLERAVRENGLPHPDYWMQMFQALP